MRKSDKTQGCENMGKRHSNVPLAGMKPTSNFQFLESSFIISIKILICIPFESIIPFLEIYIRR